MATDVKPRIRVPKSVKRGERFEVKTLVTHVMESGQRRDAQGQPIPRRILNRFTCTFNGQPVCDMTIYPAISANPYIAFFARVDQPGKLELTWYDDDGSVYKAEQAIEISA